MAPQGKRKRGERTSSNSEDVGPRPSPHRPGNSDLARDERQGGGGGQRRVSARNIGGQHGGPQRRGNERRLSSHSSGVDPNRIPVSVRTPTTPGPMSPPPIPVISRTQTPTPSSTPVVEAAPETPRAPMPQYNYEYVTDQRLSTWKSKGRRDVVEQGIGARGDEDYLEVSMLFQEMIHAVLEGVLQPAEAGEVVLDILGPEPTSTEPDPTFDARSIFLDCLSIVDGIEDASRNILFTFITATGISAYLMRQKLEAKLLQDLGLTRTSFTKVGIRKVTNLLYRQANYNLLREETEGYSKLMTELFTASTQHGASDEVISELFEIVKGLIGTFDLDVGRVLDVTLDVFAALLIKQNRFFIKFLRASSWWPRSQNTNSLVALNYGIANIPRWAVPRSELAEAMDEDESVLKTQRETRDIAFWDRARQVGLNAFFELGGRRFDGTELMSEGLGDEADSEWIQLTGTMPPPGNKTAAQLLGFKLRFYSSEFRDEEDKLPQNLMYLAALLIKIGFISLRDLYPHLWPLDEAMAGVKEKRMKELAEKEKLNRPGGSATNALMTAGALADDTAPRGRESDKPATKVEPTASTTPDADAEKASLDAADWQTNQKVSLLITLLTIGALPESLFIIGKFPWLLDAYPDELLPLIHRILHHSIDKLHSACQPVTSEVPLFPAKKFSEPDPTASGKGLIRQLDAPEKKTLRWPFPDKADTAEGKNYTYYWSDWNNNIPVCQTIEDLFVLCSSLLNSSGVNIGRDTALLSKIAKIGNYSLSTDSSPENLTRWKDLLKRTIAPALSLTSANAAVVNDVYDVMRHYSVPERFNIYAEWYEGQISRTPAMTAAFANAKRETLATMKRISKTNVRDMAAKLAKIAYSSPGIVFQVALNQIEAYSNLIEVVVECGRYFTDLGYEVLVWSLMSSLGGKDRSRVQDNGMATSRWLQALALFSGKVFKRYSIMNVTPILQYVNNQLCRGNSTDLIVLEEIITQMAGIVSDTDFNNAQLEAMTGGDVLRRQTLINLQDKRHESTKTAKRLIRALVDSNLAPQLLIAIAQARQKSAYDIPDEDAHTKLIATLTDETQRILVQFLELLRSNISIDDFDRMVPDVIQLISEYGLDSEFAFLISRASISKRIADSMLAKSNGVTNGVAEVDGNKANADDNGDSVMKEADSLGNEAAESEVGKPAGDNNGDVKTEGSPPAIASLSDAYHDVLKPVSDAIENIGPPSRWEVLRPNFFVSFWQLSLSDLILPLSSYEAEISRLAKEQADVMKDRSDMTRAGMNRKEEQKNKLAKTADDLRAELKQQIATYQTTKVRLMKERLDYFSGCHGRWDHLNEAIIEQCLFPRALLSPTDAMYCFQMIKFLHGSATPNFRTLGLQIKIFSTRRLRSMIFQCSIREAENFGRFLKEILHELARWHADQAVYEKEALGPKGDFPGYAKLIAADGKPKTVLPYEDFRRSLARIHKCLNTALRECLQDVEWTHVRNAITILKAVHEHFPAIDFMGRHFFAILTEIGKREKDKRDDLSLSANALLADLKKREKSWVMTQAFSAGADTSLDQSAIVTSNLKPTAPEFKPRANAAKAPEVEDGEVKDSKNLPSSRTPAVGSTNSAAPETKQAANPIVPILNPEPRTESRITNPPPRSENVSRPSRGPPQQPDLRNGPTNGVSSLPARPEGPAPRFVDPRSGIGRPGDRREGRDARMNEGRLNGRDHSRDFNDPNRRGPDQASRGFDDRIHPPSRELRHEIAPPQWSGEPLRDGRDGGRGGRDRLSSNGTRAPDNRPPRDTSMPAPRSLPVHSDRLALVDAERDDPMGSGPGSRLGRNFASDERLRENAQPSVPPRPIEALHPSRAALISNPETSRPDIPRHRDDRRDRDSRPGSRPQSPRRTSDRPGGPPNQAGADLRREEHANTGRTLSVDPYNNNRGRPDDQQQGSGPRSSRLRESFPPPEPIRRNTGDPNYGRLTDDNIPSGPRGRDSRTGNRTASTPQPKVEPVNGARELPRPPTPDKQPPTGPSSDRANLPNQRTRRSGIQVDTSGRGMSNSAAQLSASTPSSPGIYPDRRHGFNSGENMTSQNAQPQLQQQTPQAPQGAAPPSGLHPDRLRQLQSDEAARPPPLQTPGNSRGGRGSFSQAPSPITPRGPRNQTNSPTMAQGGFTAPTGPAERTPREPRGRGAMGPGRQQLAGINNIIQQNNGSERSSPIDRMNIRGHSERERERMNNANQIPITHSSAPNTPVVVPRPDLLPSKATPDLINPARADFIISGRGINGLEEQPPRTGSGRDHERGRSTRHGRRSSRSRSPKPRVPGLEEERPSRASRSDDRRGAMEPRDRERDGAGGRERERDSRRSAHGGSDMNRGSVPSGAGRVSGRDAEANREAMGGASRDSNSRPHERGERGVGGRDSSLRGGAAGEEVDWNNRRNPGLRDVERHDSRRSSGGVGGGDGGSGRKRRGEDGVPERGNDKRTRQR